MILDKVYRTTDGKRLRHLELLDSNFKDKFNQS